MIKITNQSAQNEIIEQLFAQVSSQNALFIEVESLPLFLSSVPSLRVFLYKIQNYPREIFWYSNENQILEFLYKNKLKIEFPYNAKNAIVTTSSNSPIVINLFKNNNNSAGNVNNYEKLSKLKSQSQPAKLNSNFDFNEISNIYKSNEKIDFKQDLDSWLQKIENTKESLSRFKNDVMTEKQNKNTNWFGALFGGQWILRSALSLCIIAIVASAVLFFPTNTYKVDIAPSIKQESFDLQFSDTVFNKTRYSLKTKNTTESSGKNELSTQGNRLSGKVALINTSPTDISIKREGLTLISEDNNLEYKHKSSTTDEASFTILAKNNLSNQPIEIDIQASESTEAYNLPINSNFRVYNNNGEAFGGVIRAISTSPIQNGNNSVDRIVTQEDLSLLRSNAENILNDQKLQKLSELKDRGELVNNNWVKTIDTAYKYDAIPNEIRQNVKIDAESQIEVYSIPNDKIKTLISSQIKINDITDLQIVDTKLSDNKVLAKMFLSFKQNPEIYKNDLIGSFAKADIVESTAQIQQKYPNIKRVSRDFSGLNLPLVTPRNNVNFNELNIQ